MKYYRFITFMVCATILFGSEKTPKINFLAQHVQDDCKDDVQMEAQANLPHQQTYLLQSVQTNILMLSRSREMISSEKMVNPNLNSASRAGIFDKQCNRITGNKIMDSLQNDSSTSSGCSFLKSKRLESNEGTFSDVESTGLHEYREVATQTDSSALYSDQATQTMPEQATEEDKKLVVVKKDYYKDKEKTCCTC